MAEDATPAELDAAALLFLDEFSADDVEEVAHAGDVGLLVSHGGEELAEQPDDVELLSSLLASPPLSSVAPREIGDGVLSLATAQLQLDSPLVLPLDFFPPSDDEREPTDTKTHVEATNPPIINQPTKLKAKRKKPNRSPNYNPNRARNERRHELVYLKQKVAEMEQELGKLRDKSSSVVVARTTQSDAFFHQQVQYMNAPQQHQVQPLSAGALAVPPSQDNGVWQRVAARQQGERRRAERENERLKIVLETQLKIARSLEHMLHKRTTMQGLEESGLGKQKRVFANTSALSDDAVFEELLDQVHRCYLDADHHFERMGIGATEVSCRDARIRDSNGSNGNRNTVDMEIFANEVLPFELHTAGKAAWQYFSIDKNHLPYRLYYERVRENKGLTEDTIIENSGLELHVNNTKAIFNLKQVLRRYVEPDRIVIAYSAVAQPVEFANKPVWGCEFREYGCMVLKRPVVHDPTTHSVLKTCYFIVPEFYGNSAGEEDDRMIGDLTEFVLSSTAATMAAWLQMIENILVVDHIGAVR